MSATQITVDRDWPAAAQYTAAAEIDVELINNSRDFAHFVISATQPAFDGKLASPIRPGEPRGLRLAAGQKVWIICPTLAEGETIDMLIHIHDTV